MLSERLTLLRKKSEKTQEDMARYLGITRPAYTAYESGRRQPDYETLQKLATYYNVTTDYLLGHSDDPASPSQPDDDQTVLFAEALKEDPELQIFWKEMLKREELKIFAKQVTKLSPKSIRIVVELIKKVEDIESNE